MSSMVWTSSYDLLMCPLMGQQDEAKNKQRYWREQKCKNGEKLDHIFVSVNQSYFSWYAIVREHTNWQTGAIRLEGWEKFGWEIKRQWKHAGWSVATHDQSRSKNSRQRQHLPVTSGQDRGSNQISFIILSNRQNAIVFSPVQIFFSPPVVLLLFVNRYALVR